ncbi:hypothetical protein I6F35_37570 [Bradyrhizobium sp. BRP22]|uniref:hypothetical protein n=1 Tax=Bradyrhizobium sp. BRP22 TaxID=2793821 RepID=UPI001CD482E7|nr:hypothetical protein [Bradyrhizobium sp. BRP22]MCA1458802.1 hypothetical protein [Bradyrhizobium sp. BRP22]
MTIEAKHHRITFISVNDKFRRSFGDGSIASLIRSSSVACQTLPGLIEPLVHAAEILQVSPAQHA